jgi:hypothetical protein
MEKMGANKTLGNLSWEELNEAFSEENLRNERLRDMSKWARALGNDSEFRKQRVAEANALTKRKMSDEDIIEMKKLYRTDITIGFPELAKIYGVDKVTIHNIMHGLIYVGIGGDVEIRAPKGICPHCGMITVKTNISRFHGDKCKSKPQNS